MSALVQNLKGERIDIGRNEPFWLNNPEVVWFVQQGKVDIFIVPLLADGASGARAHLLRVDEGQILTGFPPSAEHHNLGYLAVGTNGASLLKFPLSELRALALDATAAAGLINWLDRWIESIYAGLPGGLFPKQVNFLEPGTETTLLAEMATRPDHGVLWTTHIKGKSIMSSVPELVVDATTGLIPSTASAWIEATEETILLSGTTADVLAGQSIWSGLPQFYKLVHRWAAHALSEQVLEEKERLVIKSAAEAGALRSALSNLSGLLDKEDIEDSVSTDRSEPLLAACKLIGKASQIPIQQPPRKASSTSKNALENIAKASRFRLRRVVLSGEWWKQDGGPILGFFNESQEPVALLPSSSRSYVLRAPASGRRDVVSAEVASSINPVAYTFYRSFPSAALTVLELFKFGLHDTRPDIGMVVLLGLGGGLLGMLPPIVIGIIFDSLIPSAAATQLMSLAGGLLVASLVAVTFQVTRGIALLRVEAKSDASIQGAVWDRLLSLPLTFFRNYTAGDLAVRANGINAIRSILSGAVLTSVLSGIFSVFNFALLFYYSVRLALLAAALVAIHSGLSISISFLTLRFQRPLCDLQGKISGQVLQFITGIAKLRVAGAEVHAYSVWARSFSAQKEFHLRASAIHNVLAVLSEVYPIVTSICLFGAIAFWSEQPMSSGRFLAFTAAFSTFLYAMLELSSNAVSLLHAVPLYERAKPILDALPEVNDAKADPGELSGRVELSHVNFRYTPDGPLVLRDLSFQINPGEFIAIVGPSGSGKSTIMRLLLGFDRPESGTIYLDGLDLGGLDIQAVRRQFGVVLQNGKLMPGDIYQNIIGSSQLPIDDAWDAARKAGLDEDIEQMPMGMHTVLGEGAGTLSGGQRQRLMIARAIVAKPRILLFDEATSSLDNQTQAVVSRSLEKLQATRIVIAHRLSTIMNADRILVIQGGKLLQSGNYQELMRQEGRFAELAHRQLV